MSNLIKYRNLAIVAVVSLLIGRYVLQPKTKVETKEVIKIVEVFKERKEEKKKVKTVITETVGKDGSKQTRTEIDEDNTSVTQTNKDTKVDSEKTRVEIKGSGISLSLLAIKDVPNSRKDLSYGAVISVPVFGSLNATGMVTTDKQVGLGLGITF